MTPEVMTGTSLYSPPLVATVPNGQPSLSTSSNSRSRRFKLRITS